MTTQTEALKLALEALTIADNIALVGAAYTPRSIDLGLQKISSAITAIKEALAQPEQEPVAWQVEVLIQGVWSPMGNPQRDKDRAEKLAANPSIPKECQRVIELYTTPPQRKPLTDEQIDEAIQQHVDPVATYRKLHDFARAIEAAHGIKGD